MTQIIIIIIAVTLISLCYGHYRLRQVVGEMSERMHGMESKLDVHSTDIEALTKKACKCTAKKVVGRPKKC